LKLKIFKNKTELAYAFCDKLTQLTLGKEKFFIALSGGNTPKVIFQTLAKDFSKKIEWKKIHLFWGDERCVPPEHAESNYGVAKEYLLDNIDIPEENVHRIKGENNPVYEAERYSEEMSKCLPEVNGLPQFDVIILGVGVDGHIASIFPDQMELLSSEKICDTSVHPSTKQKRITLTGKVINNSQRVYIIIMGINKALILTSIVNKIDDYKKYPAAYIKPSGGLLEWYLNTEEDPGILYLGNISKSK
jgi:6-phosphogluconolactonase